MSMTGLGEYKVNNNSLTLTPNDTLSTVLNKIDYTWEPTVTSQSQIGPTVSNAANLPVETTSIYGLSPELSKVLIDNTKAETDWLKTKRQDYLDYKKSFMGKAEPYVQGFSGIASGLGSLANIYTGFKQLGMMEDQLDIAKDQWAETKSELARVKGVRDKLNSSYMA